MTRTMRDPAALIDTASLSALLGDPQLRLFDCTTFLDRLPPGSAQPYNAISGRANFEAAHIAGAGFLDLQGEFSDRTSPYHFMLPDVQQLESAFGRHGIGAGTRVVLYSAGAMMWATRFWWMLKALGFDNVAVLDGGLDKWLAEGRPVEAGPPNAWPATGFRARPVPGRFLGSADVAAALGRDDTVIVNALSPDYHAGLEPTSYGRSGRIPGSVNLHWADLVDPETKNFGPLDQAAAAAEARGVTGDKQVICYCGGGISATLDLFMLYQLGYEKLSLYDGSLGEWAKDESLPVETD